MGLTSETSCLRLHCDMQSRSGRLWPTILFRTFIQILPKLSLSAWLLVQFQLRQNYPNHLARNATVLNLYGLYYNARSVGLTDTQQLHSYLDNSHRRSLFSVILASSLLKTSCVFDWRSVHLDVNLLDSLG
jgi:hypothetical protein